MNRHQASHVPGLACLVLSACWGCVERSEVITVARDGSVIIELEHEGSEEELTTGDAMPSIESGWNVVRSTKKDGDQVKHILTTRRRFAPREELPRTFAAPNDAQAGLYLDFPTTVRMERRPDGMYYYFHRVYTPRRWAYVQHWQDAFIDDDIRKLGEKPAEELTPEEQLQIAQAFARVEALKQLEFTKIAMAKSHPDLPVERRLIARRALIDVYTENDDLERIFELCEDLPDEERGSCFDEQAERLLAKGYAAFVESLQRDTDLSDAQVARFQQAYERAKRYYEITDALGGHSFEIAVRMPGVIVAHNAFGDEVEEEENGMSNVAFQFDGKAFRDRALEMIVVSRVEGRSSAGWKDRVHDGDR